MEARGYPGWVRSPADEELYVGKFWKKEGIRIDRESIKSNAAKRGLAKLCLNCMWGKRNERSDRTQSRVITEPKELYNFLATPGIQVTNLPFANDDVVWISWKHSAEEHVPNLRYTNVVMALLSPKLPGYICIAISTGWAREPSIATPIPSSTFSPETNLISLKRGTNRAT